MRIAIFHNLPPGGAKRAVFEESKFLSEKHNIDLFLYTGKKNNFLNIRPYVNKVKYFNFFLDENNISVFNRLHNDFKIFCFLNNVSKKMAKEINDGDYDVCLVHPDSYTQAPFILRYLEIPSLYFCEEYLRIVYEDQFKFKKTGNALKDLYEKYTRNIRKRIDKKNAKSADLIVANSQFTKNNIEFAYKVKAKYCHLGVDVDTFKNVKGKRKKGNYILFVGDLNDQLGYAMAEEITKRLKAKYKINLLKLGFSKGSERINNDNKMAEEYSNAIATICTHKNEPFGLPPLESMACETPVIAVNEGGYKETILEKETGFLVPRDPNEFVKKIKYLIDNPNFSIKLGKRGRKHVKNNFSWKKHNKFIEKQLKLLKNKSSR
jgi:glycosyltransferase involved in cell wall biosynthesis